MKYLFLLDFWNFKFIIPEIFFFSSLIFLILFLLFFSFSRIYKFPLIMSIGTYLSVLNLFFVFFLYLNNLNLKALLFNNSFLVCFGFSNIKLFVIFFTLIFFIISLEYLKYEQINDFEYFVLILLITFGVVLFVSSNDFILTFLTIEVQSLSLFVLVTFKKNTIFSTEAGLKYFILGSLSSIFLLFGMSLFYFTFGTTNFQEISLLFFYNFDLNIFTILSFFSLIFILSGFFFKLSLVPLHMWLSDVYEGAPSIITLYMAVVPKIAFLIVICRLFFLNFPSFFFNFQNIIIFISICSIFIGSFLGISQKKFKRLLAYSTISHVGFIFLAISSGYLEGLRSFLIYLIIYMITSICLWGIVSSLRLKKNSFLIFFITDLKSLYFINPSLVLIFSLILLSLAGIPPLVGFWAKFLILLSVINSSFYLVSVLIILISSISTFYYLRIVKVLFFNDKFNLEYISLNLISKETALIVSFFFIFLMFFLFNPSFLIILTNKIIFSIF